MNRLSLRNNRLKLKTAGNLLIILEIFLQNNFFWYKFRLGYDPMNGENRPLVTDEPVELEE